MSKIIKVTEENYNLIINALESYLSAGSKEERRKASIIAKAAYYNITGHEYTNNQKISNFN